MGNAVEAIWGVEAVRRPREEGDCPICGKDSCEDHLKAPALSRANLRVLTAFEAMALPRPRAILDGLAWETCVSVLVSESGAGKTFLLLDAAGAVSDGVNWHGRRVSAGSVVYVDYEGDALGLRLRALREVAGHRLENVYLIQASQPLSPVGRDGSEGSSLGEIELTDAIRDLAARLERERKPPIVLVIVDTARASMSGDEDRSSDVSAYIRAIRRIIAGAPGAAAIIAHHSGWQDGESKRKRERGSSAWRGNCDATFYLELGDYDSERGTARLTLSALKVRDSERPAPLHLIRRRVDILALDDRGEPETSCIIERDTRTKAQAEAEKAEKAEAEAQETDRQTLSAIAENPEFATSQENVRKLLGVRATVVSDSIARLMRSGKLRPGKRGKPYEILDNGQP